LKRWSKRRRKRKRFRIRHCNSDDIPYLFCEERAAGNPLPKFSGPSRSLWFLSETLGKPYRRILLLNWTSGGLLTPAR
jgi:hypothetical protein